MRRPNLLSLTCLLAIVLLPTLILAADPAVTPAPAKPVVLIDQGHGQRFLIEEKGTLHLSSLAGIIAGTGATVTSTTAPLDDAALAKVSALVISGPFQPLPPQEVAAVLHFVENGGRLVVMTHIPQPLGELLFGLGVKFSNFVLQERENLIEGDSRNFRVVDLNAAEMFRGVKGVSFYGTWALANLGTNGAVVAKSSARAWLDLDGDKQLTDADAVGSYGVAVLGRRGKGHFLVLGDDALFQNRFMDEQNSTFAVNLANWLVAAPTN